MTSIMRMLLVSLTLLVGGCTSAKVRPLDRGDIESVVEWLSKRVETGQFNELKWLVKIRGVKVVPYAICSPLIMSNNGDEVVRWLEDGATKEGLRVVGHYPDFGALPDKAMILISGLDLDRQIEFESGKGAKLCGFHFQRWDGFWELVAITPMGRRFSPEQLPGYVKR